MPQQLLKITLLILTASAIISCRKTNYGTSIAIQSLLDEEMEVEVFPVESPYSNMTKFLFSEGEIASIFHTGVTDESPLELLSNAFDSIHIQLVRSDNIIVLTRDTAIGYAANPYQEIEIWHDTTVLFEECTMVCEDHENLVHYFCIEPDMILVDK